MRYIQRVSRVFIFCLFLWTPLVSLSARGKQEEEPPKPVNGEYVLCIAAFDVSALPPAQQILGSVLQRELVLDLGRIHHRLRGGEEILRYEELAWAGAVRQTAAQIGEKRAERDALLYQGLPGWKYRKEIRRIRKELEALEKECARAEGEKPIIEEKPLFKINEANLQGVFPPPPGPGEEEIFLKANGADVLLAAQMRIHYGRIHIEFRLYGRGASFEYKDSAIFSQEDLNPVADELKDRFMRALAGSDPARLALYAKPGEARIQINGRSVQNGVPLQFPPGPVQITVNAADHRGETREWEAGAGEQTSYFFVLRPLAMENLGLTLQGLNPSVYMGALYLGGSPKAPETEEGGISPELAWVTPEEAAAASLTPAEEARAEDTGNGVFTLNIPMGEYRYIRIDTEDGLTGETIVKGSPQGPGGNRIITLQPRKLPGPDDKPVDVKRRKFYGAYGRLWVFLPLAFLVNGITRSYNTPNIPVMYEKYKDWHMDYLTIGAWALTGVFLVESLIRMGIYVHTATRESVPLWE
ncbi:MAG: hypothetical protein LBD31_07705 [Treponema sp.]|nr:hypothetical protein [Treponema sp.]